MARPGHRAPHFWLARDGRPLSTLDLFDTAFVLLMGPAGQAWAELVGPAARDGGVPVHCLRIGADLDDPTGTWPAVYGVGDDGAVLVRPDGMVAARWPSARASGTGVSDAGAALSRLLS